MNPIDVSHMLLFGNNIDNIPDGYFGTNNLLVNLSTIMTVYTRVSIPVNFNNGPNELKF